MCVRAQLCLTLCDTKDCSLSDSSVRGIFQARILEWVATSSSRGYSWPRDGTCVSFISRQILCHWAIWETHPFSKTAPNTKLTQYGLKLLSVTPRCTVYRVLPVSLILLELREVSKSPRQNLSFPPFLFNTQKGDKSLTSELFPRSPLWPTFLAVIKALFTEYCSFHICRTEYILSVLALISWLQQSPETDY